MVNNFPEINFFEFLLFLNNKKLKNIKIIIKNGTHLLWGKQ